MKDASDSTLTAKVNDLITYCQRQGIPVFVSAYDKDEGKYWNRTVTPTELGMKIPDDKYPEFIRVLMGFDFENYED